MECWPQNGLKNYDLFFSPKLISTIFLFLAHSAERTSTLPTISVSQLHGKKGTTLSSTNLRKHDKKALTKKFPSKYDVLNKISKENKNYIRKRKHIDFTMDDLDEDTELLQNNEDIEFRSKSKLMMLTNSNDANFTKRDVPKRLCTKFVNYE